jgi:hypothetical protein
VVVLLALLVLVVVVVVVVGGGGGGVTRAASLTRARRGPCATRLCANKPRRFFFQPAQRTVRRAEHGPLRCAGDRRWPPGTSRGERAAGGAAGRRLHHRELRHKGARAIYRQPTSSPNVNSRGWAGSVVRRQGPLQRRKAAGL